MSLKVKIEQLLSGQLPAFVRDEYPGFATFLEAYYRFLEQEGQPQDLLNTAPSWLDVDSTLDVFVQRMRMQYAADISEKALLDNKTIIKQIDEYYSTKGSKQATELFFRMMFNDLVQIQYPGQFILRASDGHWEKRRTIKMDTEGYQGNPFDLQSKRVTLTFNRYVPQIGVRPLSIDTEVLAVTGTNDPYIFTLDVSPTAEQIQTAIDAEDQFGLSMLGYFFSNYTADDYVVSPTVGEIDKSIRVYYGGNAYGQLTRQLLNYEVLTHGARFRIGETFIIDEQGGGGAYFAEDYTVDTTGPDMYAGNDIQNRAILRVTDTYGTDGLGAIKILASGFRFKSNTFTTTLAPMRTGGLPATVVFYTGFVKTYPGKFRSPAGFLSDINKLEDNERIQPYSYVIRTHIPIQTWRSQYKNSAHPAGLRLYAQLMLDGNIGMYGRVNQNGDQVDDWTFPYNNPDVIGGIVIPRPPVPTLNFVFAHRGGASGPEDSTINWVYGLQAGFPVEGDVRITSDSVQVLMHDVNVDRTVPPNTGTIASKTAAELDAMHYDRYNHIGFATEPVSRLDAALLAVKANNGWCLPECEAQTLAGLRALVVEARTLGIGDRCIFQMFENSPYAILKQVAAENPDYKFMVNFETGDPLPNFDEIAAAGIDFVTMDISSSWVTKTNFDAAHAVGLKLVPYVVDNYTDLAKAKTAGADHVFSNRPRYIARGALAPGAPFEETWTTDSKWKFADDWFVDGATVPSLNAPRPYNGFAGTPNANITAPVGAVCEGRPLPASDKTYELDFNITLNTANADNTRWAGIQFALQSVSLVRNFAPVDAGDNGYGIIFRQNGLIEIGKYVAGSNSTTIASVNSTAFVVGQSVPIRVHITPTSITVRRLDTSHYCVAIDSDFRAGLFGLVWSGAGFGFGPFTGHEIVEGSDPLPTLPFVWAHRGGASMPEDSAENWENAVQAGFVAEGDVRQSSDGVQFLMHDTTVDRTSPPNTGTVASKTAAQLDAMLYDRWNSVGFATTPISRYTAALQKVKDLNGWCSPEAEVQTLAGLRKIVDEARILGMEDKCIFQMFEAAPYPILAQVAAENPALKFLVLFNTGSSVPNFNTIALAGIRYVGMDINDSWVTSANIAAGHALGLQFVAYTVNTVAQLNTATTAGVDHVFSDRPRYIARGGPAAPAPFNETWTTDSKWRFADDWTIDGAPVPSVNSPRPFNGRVGMPTTAISTPVGAVCDGRPLPIAADSYELVFDARIDVANADNTRWAGVQFALQQNSLVRNFSPVDVGDAGYGLVVRQNGQWYIDRYDSGVNSTIIAGPFSSPALTVGVAVQFKIRVTHDRITVTRVDTGDQLSVADGTYRGGLLGFVWSSSGMSFGPVVGTPVPSLPDVTDNRMYMRMSAQSLTPVADGTEILTVPNTGFTGSNFVSGSMFGSGPRYKINQFCTKPGLEMPTIGGNTRPYSMPSIGTKPVPTESHVFVVLKGCGGAFSVNGFNPTSFPCGPNQIMSDNHATNSQKSFPIPVDPTQPFLYHSHGKAGLWEAYVGLTKIYSTTTNTYGFGLGDIGGYYAGGFFTTMFGGYIAEWRFYAGLLTDDEILGIKTQMAVDWCLTLVDSDYRDFTDDFSDDYS
jgi:glycerophosphoryl diester phosphodiesterase